MRDRKRRDLREQRLDARRQKKKSEDEEDVIESARNDVRESEDDILAKDLESRRRNHVARKHERRAERIAFEPLSRRAVSLIFERDHV